MLKLAAFDFDHTIIDLNSDIFIDKLIKPLDQKRYKYPDEIEMLTESLNWTHRMNAVNESK